MTKVPIRLQSKNKRMILKALDGIGITSTTAAAEKSPAGMVSFGVWDSGNGHSDRAVRS